MTNYQSYTSLQVKMDCRRLGQVKQIWFRDMLHISTWPKPFWSLRLQQFIFVWDLLCPWSNNTAVRLASSLQGNPSRSSFHWCLVSRSCWMLMKRIMAFRREVLCFYNVQKVKTICFVETRKRMLFTLCTDILL